MESFEAWLLHRVAQAVEAGEVSADLLSELRTEMERARGLPQEEGHALAVQDIAGRLGLSADQVETMLAALEAQPTVTRELLLRRIVDAWLRGRGQSEGWPENESATARWICLSSWEAASSVAKGAPDSNATHAGKNLDRIGLMG